MADPRPPQIENVGAPTPPVKKGGSVGGVSFVPKESVPEIQEKDPTRDEVRRGLEHAGIATEYAPSERVEEGSSKSGESTTLRQLRTYSDDVATILKKTGGSKIAIQTAQREREEERRREKKQQEEEEARELQREQKLRMQEEALRREQARREQEKIIQKEHGQPVAREEEKQKEREVLKKREKAPAQDGLEQRKQQIEAEQKIREEQERIRSEQIKIRNARETRREDSYAQPATVLDEEKRHKRIGAIAMSVVLLLLGSGALFGAYTFFFTEEKVPQELSIDTIILAEKSVDIDITNLAQSDVQARLTQTRDTASIPRNTIAHFRVLRKIATEKEGVIVEQELTAPSLLEAIAPRIPEALARSFEDSFMLGRYASNQGGMFLILKPTFYENAFAGMLTWEKDMRDDLSPLFGARNNNQQQNGTSTSPLLNSHFTDKVIENKDTRIVVDSQGEIVLLYSFVDRNTLIITSSKEAFLEVFTRLSAKRISR